MTSVTVRYDDYYIHRINNKDGHFYIICANADEEVVESGILRLKDAMDIIDRYKYCKNEL